MSAQSYDEMKRSLERITNIAKFALADLRCGLANRAAYRLEYLLEIRSELGETDAAKITSLEERRLTQYLKENFPQEAGSERADCRR